MTFRIALDAGADLRSFGTARGLMSEGGVPGSALSAPDEVATGSRR